MRTADARSAAHELPDFWANLSDGDVAVCLTFDHRVMDGRHAARALEDMEAILNSTLVTELRLGFNQPAVERDVVVTTDAVPA